MNTLEDFQRLASALASYDQPVRIGFEATGNYHRPLAHHLGQLGFQLNLVSSVGLARTREALHNSCDKNDPKDAQVLLHMLEIGAVQFVHDPLVTGTADVQELSKTHEIVSRSKTELWHPPPDRRLLAFAERRPFFEGVSPGGKTSLCSGRGGSSLTS